MNIGTKYYQTLLAELPPLISQWIQHKIATGTVPDILVPTNFHSSEKRKLLGFIRITRQVVTPGTMAGWATGVSTPDSYLLEDGTLWMAHLVRVTSGYTGRLKRSYTRMAPIDVTSPDLPVWMLQGLTDVCRATLR